MSYYFNLNREDSYKNYFKKHGFCVIQNVVDPASLEILKTKLHEIALHLASSNAQRGVYINFADASTGIVNSLHRLDELNDPYLQDFVKSFSFLDIASSLMGDDVKLFSLQAFLKPRGSGLATPPHQDNAYWNRSGFGGITMWLSLDHADESNGMVKYGLMDEYFLFPHDPSSSTPGSSLVVPKNLLSGCNWIQPSLEPGDVAIHHGLVPHYSDINNSEYPRRGFLLNFCSSHHILDENQFQTYLDDLGKIVQKN